MSETETDTTTDTRCPKCQFFALLVLGIIGSIAIFGAFSLLPQYTEQQQFLVNSVKTYVQGEHVLIDADLTMNFSAEVIDALENGIPLTIAVEVQVFRQREWWRNVIVKESTQLFELAYHPLTNVHVVKNLATDDRYSFNSREEALNVLGTIRGAHLIEKNQLNKDEQYYVQIHTLLDINHLPPALRQIAALSSAWRLESSWSRWPIDINASSGQVVPLASKPQIQSEPELQLPTKSDSRQADDVVIEVQP